MIRERLLASALTAALLAMAGCSGGGGGGSSGTGATNPTVPSATVSGAAAKGLLLNAIVSFYSVVNGVESTTAITSVRTDSKTGAFTATVASAGPVVVTVTTDATTQMLDEISGTATAAPSGLVLHTVFDSVTDLQPIAVTPLTEMAYGIAKAQSGGLTSTNIDSANNAVSTAFLGGAPVLNTQPINIANYASATAAAQALAKLLAALAVAANEGIATGASGSACATNYSANIVCLIGGLTKLVSINSTGGITLTSAASYISSAYTSIDSGVVTLDGGKLPSALGLNVPTAAETAFKTAVATQAPLPGYNSGANPLANTKALFANIRTNIIDQTSTQTFGFAPTLTALENDYQKNVHPVLANTSSLLSSAYTAAQLILSGTTSDGKGLPSPNIVNPSLLTVDPSGNIYVINSNNTIAKITGTTVTLFAGQAGVFGSADGTGSEATFSNPTGLAADSAGNIYVSDSGNNTIRQITPAGVVTTLAGSPGVAGNSDGTGSAASFVFPAAIAVASNGIVYVADDGNGAIRTIAPGGVVSTVVIQPGGDCSSYPGYLPGQGCLIDYEIGGIAVDGAGDIYVSNPGAGIIQLITASGVISVLAGQPGVYGAVDGQGTAATFGYPTQLTIDGSGNLYVIDFTNAEIREITPSGTVSTVAGSNALGSLNGIALNPAGGYYVSNGTRGSVQEISASGAISTLVRGVANYQKGCGYDPVGLGTAANVALCRYGLSQGDILLTVTQTGTNTYSLQTQAVAAAPYVGSTYNPVTSGYAVIGSIPALTSTFTWTSSSSGAQSATLAGPYYVNATGGQVTASLNAAESTDWNAVTDSGSITLGGTLSGGAGGVALITAQVGSDSVITIQNGSRLLTSPVTPIVSAGSSPVTITGALDLQEFDTGAFSYAVKALIGAPVADKSGAAAPPSSITITGSIGQIVATSTTPVFTGSVSLSIQGFPAFDATKPISATNYFTLEAQLAGTLNLTGGRVLTVSATANASQITPTAALPDSMAVTYSYATPSGTAQLNASGKYDATEGFSGTLTNNAGVVIAVTDPIGGSVTGTVTANGTETATIKGAFIYYSDGTSESLF
jgi:hypothetical protein